MFVDSGSLCPCSLCCEVWPAGIVWRWGMEVGRCSLSAEGVHEISGF